MSDDDHSHDANERNERSADSEPNADGTDERTAGDTAAERDTADGPGFPDAHPRPEDRTDERRGPGRIEGQRPPYTESQVIMTTVKVVTPFVFTYGLFVTFHGASSPGGGFQGGALMASVVIMMAFAFGIDSTRQWLSNTVIVGLGVVGVAFFGAVGLGTVAYGGAFLEYEEYPIHHSAAYGIEAVEIGGIALIVTGVFIGLFFLLAAGFDPEVEN